MAVRLDTDGAKYDQYFPIILESVEYIFHIYWNDTLRLRGFSDSGWYLSVYEAIGYHEGKDNQEVLIFGGRKLMPQQDVLGRSTDSRLPRGKLYCLDTNPALGEVNNYTVGRDTFGKGKRFQLYYYTQEEIVNLKAELS